MNNVELNQSPLGKKSKLISHYQRDLLCPIPRCIQRDSLGIKDKLPFQGEDIWNAYEISWLNPKGKPMVALLECRVPCESVNLIESKSLKLYLNSYNQTVFDSFAAVENSLIRDLSDAAGASVLVKLMLLDDIHAKVIHQLQGVSLDELDIVCDTYQLSPHYLITEDSMVTETLYSHLLKSNCLVTGQPDWGSVQITYTGRKIEREGLLKYLISFRHHDEFHEHCVERIFMDITERCAPESLSVMARYTRRGGIDINPYRSSLAMTVDNQRLVRQ